MPVTTRRRSRSVLRRRDAVDQSATRRSLQGQLLRTVQESDDDDDDPMDGGSLTGLSSSEEEDEDEEHVSVWSDPESDTSETETESNRDGPDSGDNFEVTLPMAKRRKSETSTPSGKDSSSRSPAKTKKTGMRRRVLGRLKDILSMPLDVLFLIFSELGPMDLVHVSRTNKALRQLLMSCKSMSVWIAARRHAGATRVPDPPEDMSEPAWAQLLFGPAVCSHCSTKNIQRIDFGLRRRLCIACKKRNLVFSVKFRSRCPGLKDSVMDLVPYTKFGAWGHGFASNSRFYWKPDLLEMGKKVAELEDDVKAGKPGAKQRLKSFRVERILLVDSIVQSSAEFEQWATLEELTQADVAEERRTQRHEALKARILAAGYDSADIDIIGISAVPGANINKELTEEGWRRIKRRVELELDSCRKARLHAEGRRRESEYIAQAEQRYTEFLRQVLPIQRLYIPSWHQVRELSCFEDHLNPDSDEQPADWVDAEERIRESVTEWMSVHRDRYTSLLPSSEDRGTQRGAMKGVIMLSDPFIEAWRYKEAMRDFAGNVELATSVFRHLGTDTILIGREACHAWKYQEEVEFVERGAEAVRALLEVLQLDPATTTVPMLEELNKRIVCDICPEFANPYHYSWRAWVLHFMDYSDSSHPHLRLLAMSPEEAATEWWALETTEDSWYPPLPETWLCNHCSEYLSPGPFEPFGLVNRTGSKGDAIRHVQTEHHIAHPTVDEDVFSYPTFNQHWQFSDGAIE